MTNAEAVADELRRTIDTRRQERKDTTLSRFKLFLARESASGEEGHLAVAALQAIEAGNTGAAIQYLNATIDEARARHRASDDQVARARLELRIDDLERWKQSLI